MEADCIYIGIGNTDDKLAQAEWAEFVKEAALACEYAGKLIGIWLSEPSSHYQNACFCIKMPKPVREKWLRQKLGELAAKYYQDSISWATARTEYVRGTDGTDRRQK